MNCRNCGAALVGPYCAQCGQHAHDSLRSLRALLHDAWDLATHLDGRFWRSMYTLFLWPGRLTREFFEDHRARFISPVRLYLAISVLFFAFVASTPTPVAHHPASFASGENSVIDADDEKDDKPNATDDRVNHFIEGVSDCRNMRFTSVWLAHRMHEVCERYDDNITLPVEQNLYHNLPRMMIVLTPLVAVAMLLIYRNPRRYYVEHVVFSVHNHAAIFLIWIFIGVLRFIGKQVHSNWLGESALALGMLYTLWYVYESMRVYYSQVRLVTFGKMMFMYFVYFSVLSLMGLATFFISELTA